MKIIIPFRFSNHSPSHLLTIAHAKFNNLLIGRAFFGTNFVLE